MADSDVVVEKKVLPSGISVCVDGGMENPDTKSKALKRRLIEEFLDEGALETLEKIFSSAQEPWDFDDEDYAINLYEKCLASNKRPIQKSELSRRMAVLRHAATIDVDTSVRRFRRFRNAIENKPSP